MYELVESLGPRHPGGAHARLSRAPDRQCEAAIALVANEKNIPVRLLMHKSRCRVDAARARQLAMYLCHVALGRSLREVGVVFGRDRTTVSYACALIEDMRDDSRFDDEVAALEARIEAANGAR